MSKFPLQWHKDGLANCERSLAEKKEELKRRTESLTRDIARMTADIEFTKKQIQAAIEKGMDGFDEERFLKKERDEFFKSAYNKVKGE